MSYPPRTPDSWIERRPEDEHHNYLCSHCECAPCRCDEYDELTAREDMEQLIDDTVRCCPECETPNQFGELCNRCRGDIERERYE